MTESTIYISGNPELYPVEYYDSADHAYEGVIPELLEDFAKENGYDIIYYEADGKDHRERHFDNIQVDAVSGVGDDFRPEGETVTVFETEQGGEMITYGITFTEAAPERFREDLTEYIAGISGSEKAGLLMAAANEERETRPVDGRLLGVLAALVIAAGVLGGLLYRYRRQARHSELMLGRDTATGLGNREYLEKYYSQFINDHNRVMYSMYYFYIDTERLTRLDGKKQAEDAVRYAGAVLNEYAGEMDILARISEEGIVLLKLGGKERENAVWLYTALERIRAYSEQYGNDHGIHAWTGVYPLRQTDKSLDDIILNARQSAYMAQRDNVDFRVCSDELLARFREQKMIEGDIERAFTNREFQMYLQFYVETETGRINGAEALTRWMHPGKGLLSPGAFIPVLERTGDISRLDYLMLEYVCAFLERNFGCRSDGFFLSCNFSRTTFTSPDFAERCKEITEQYKFNKSLLTFELTESPDPGDVEQIRKNAEQLKAYGIRLALDDFGEGYTSLKDLLNYPIDIIKLDKSLTDSITGEKGRRILQTLISAGHEASMKCLAEGVEDEQVLEILKEMSCDAVQGYMFYYPLPEPEAEDILKGRSQNHEEETEKTDKTEKYHTGSEI